ncbi:hypothetical protein PPSIR1_26176 [Plesiocystis pacifica SIR-1]|uniref:Lipoprotein n=1 Tax=Plesiocystis pacifica SIR-1 TaxID=391625 RepID=A6GFX9_9BACT|nr:hypothetical protein [Plesiocystis pacifica]EDM75224.1 hypothetical protein PPSIR1_26176 [Plesiocystis pacifica SIR-1]
MSRTRTELPKTPLLTLALAGLATLGGCSKFTAPKTNPEEVKALETYQARVEAFAAAAASVPADLPALASVKLPAPLESCGAMRCDDGGVGNAKLVSDLEGLRSSTRNMLEAAKAGREDFNLSYMRERGYFEALPELDYFALVQPDQEASYEDGQNGSWRGRVVVWDANANTWIGAVSVDLTGPDPSVIVTNVEFGPGGSQTITYIDDASGDRSRAQAKFDQVLRRAYTAALTHGVDVTRPEQALRDAPRDIAVELPKAGVVVVEGSGVARVLSAEGVLDPALNEVTDVVVTPSGVAFHRAANALAEGVSDLVVVEGKTVYDARSWADWGPSRNVRLRLDEGQLWMFDSVDGDRAGYWTGASWSYLAKPEGELGFKEVAKGSAGAVLLGVDGSGGSRLYLQQGEGWSSLDIDGQPMAVAAVGERSYVGTTTGLWQVEAGEATRLIKGPSRNLTDFAGGVVASNQRKLGYSKGELVRVVDGELSRLGLKIDSYDEFAVGSKGEVVVESEGGLSLAVPGAERVEIALEGDVESLDFDAAGRLWIGTDAAVYCWSAGELSPITVEGVTSVRIIRAIGEGLDPSAVSAG